MHPLHAPNPTARAQQKTVHKFALLLRCRSGAATGSRTSQNFAAIGALLYHPGSVSLQYNQNAFKRKFKNELFFWEVLNDKELNL